MSTTTEQSSNTADEWIELNEPKQFSRLLYTNPVCFLSTTTTTTTEQQQQRKNVMVLSWLTATNNEGRFMFSLNRRRHTASVISEEGCTFVLSVPVKGMENLVKEVGGVSGRWGSKFVEDHHTGEEQQRKEFASRQEGEPPLSKRQKKKQQQQANRSLGIEGLKAVPLGLRPDDENSGGLFAVDGTIAHLHCRVYSMIKEAVIDEDHYLILGEVTRAFVHGSYWDAAKNLFRPDDQSPPYLTFFGSQTFGYVVASSRAS